MWYGAENYSFDKQLNAALANVEQIPLHTMMNLVIWEPPNVLFDEAVEAANLKDSDILRDGDFTRGCASVIAKNLKMANGIEFSHAVNTLLVKLKSEDFMSSAAKILVDVAERLTPVQQQYVEYELHLAWEYSLEECNFNHDLFPLLPMLAKKQPGLGIDVHTGVTQGLKFWFVNGSIPDVTGVIDAISDMRRCLTQETCDDVCDRLREVSDSYYTQGARRDNVRYFRESLERALERLSRPSMTWTRILTKVRVVGSLSLMRAESAERLYKPGGAGATAAVGRLVAGAKRQLSEV